MTTSFSIKAESFEGPLEALLDLIESRKLSISQVNLSDVCDAYLAHVEKLSEMPLGQTAQFILVASTLLLIKSRTLLPSLDLTVDERESVEELERRLAHYALIRKAARLLRAEWDAAPLALPARSPVRLSVFSPAETSIASIAEAARRIMDSLPKPSALARATVAPVIALEDVIRSVHARLAQALKTRFFDLTRSGDRHAVIVHFLAILELVRAGSASVSQEKLFSDIEIELERLGAPSYGTSI